MEILDVITRVRKYAKSISPRHPSINFLDGEFNDQNGVLRGEA